MLFHYFVIIYCNALVESNYYAYHSVALTIPGVGVLVLVPLSRAISSCQTVWYGFLFLTEMYCH